MRDRARTDLLNQKFNNRIENIGEKLEQLLKEWHELGRENFNKNYSNLNYDTYEPKILIEKSKYYYLNERTCGVYMVDKFSGDIFRIKAYGQINKNKKIGNISTITGRDLLRFRWY